MVAVRTWLASTLAFQSLEVRSVRRVDGPGRKSSASVLNRPISHSVWSHRGGGGGGGGFGGSVGGPGLAGFEGWRWKDDIGASHGCARPHGACHPAIR